MKQTSEYCMKRQLMEGMGVREVVGNVRREVGIAGRTVEIERKGETGPGMEK
jgi:hypothetical protein